jgi:GlcNAc-P-P-Und epimerase
MKRAAVIGGSGFIGTRLRQLLRREGWSCTVVDIRKPLTEEDPFLEADVRDIPGLAAAIGRIRPDTIVNLAAEHRDDVSPKEKYYTVNVDGARNTCAAAAACGAGRIVFTSSVAVYGLAGRNADESSPCRPFNEYGRTKMLAEDEYRKWQEERPIERSLTIIRPTVVFGERNRGNVYNLLNQIARGTFFFVGDGRNRKSMSYVENVAGFIHFGMSLGPGSQLFNYVDKPDMDMNGLVSAVETILGRGRRTMPRIPYPLGIMGGMAFDAVAWATGRKFAISAVRVRKFCAETSFASARLGGTGFVPPVPLPDALERTIRFEFTETHEGALFESE